MMHIHKALVEKDECIFIYHFILFISLLGVDCITLEVFGGNTQIYALCAEVAIKLLRHIHQR